MSLRALATMVALGLGARAARAEVRAQLVPELRLSAGYDDNLFLDANPAGALPSQARADAIFDVAPRLTGRLLAGGHALTLTLDYLERATPSTGDLRDFAAHLDWLSPALGSAAPVRLLAAAVYEHYEASAFVEDTFDLGGGEAGVRVLAGDRVRMEARARVAARSYSGARRVTMLGFAQVDVEERASATVHARLASFLDGEAGYGYLHVGSNNSQAVLDRHRGDVALIARPSPWLTLTAAFGLGGQHLPNGALLVGAGPRDDLFQEIAVSVAGRPLSWLELFVRYDLLLSSSSAPTGDWHRNQVLGGLGFSYPLERRWSKLPPTAPSLSPSLDGNGAHVTFRYRGAAREVSVVGDWNSWTPGAQPLRPTAPGRMEATYLIPPGRHEYALSVDGTTTSPPDAPASVPDGFGGRNGVVTVP